MSITFGCGFFVLDNYQGDESARNDRGSVACVGGNDA